jgi:hypothetical protein
MRHILTLIILLVCLLSLAATVVGQPTSQVYAVHIAVTPTRRPPPPLPTTTPTAIPSTPKSKTDDSAGALIWLRLKLASPIAERWQNVWTEVRWQDGFGDWHTVEGWRGGLDDFMGDEGRKVWWLPKRLFDAGPFRWQVYTAQDGELLLESGPFNLPQRTGQVVKITLGE